MKDKKSNKQLDKSTGIQCRLCKRRFLTISRTHLYYRHHGVTQAEYKEEYELPTIASALKEWARRRLAARGEKS